MVHTIEPPIKPEATDTHEENTPIPAVDEAAGENASAVQPLIANEKQRKSLPEAPKKLLHRFEDFCIPALILFLVGNALAFALPDLAFTHYKVGLPIILILLGVVVYGGGKTENRWVIRLDLWVICLLAGSLYYSHRQFNPGPTDVSHMAPLERTELMGTLVSRSAKNQVILEISSVDGKKATGRVMAYLPPDNANDDLEAGTRLLVDGSLELPFSSPVPGTFNQQDYLRSQHITALLKRPNRLIAFEASSQPRFALQRMTDQLKQQVATTFAHSLPSPQSEILGGIVLGDKAIPVDHATKQAFIQTGLIHVLAASGMNVGIIAGAVLWLLSLLKVPYRTRLGIAMGAVAFYSLLTGLPPSIQRAAAMLELALFLKLLNRELSPMLLLCLASGLLVAINPENIASVGFQFSVLTTFGLLAMVPPLQEAIGYYTTRWLAGLVLVPLVAQLWIWPLSVAYFNQFPIHSIPLNILAVALVVPLTIIGFIAGVISLIFPPVAGWLSLLAKPILDVLLWMVNWGNGQSWAQWSLPSPAAWQIAMLYICLFTSLLAIHRMKDWTRLQRALVGLLPVVLLLGSTCLENSFARYQNHIDLLPISARREAVLIQPANSNTRLLIAPEAPTYYEARTLADYLKHRHITRLSAVLLLPEPEPSTDGSGSLSAAFPRTEIDLLLTNDNLPISNKLPVHKHQVFPPQGGQIDLGPLKLQGQLTNLRLLHQRYCLMSLSQNTQPDGASLGCGLQASIGPDGKRFFSDLNLSPDGFYHLVAERSELTVY